MRHSSRTRRAPATALAAAFLAGWITLPAFAGLGGDASTVDTDVVKMKAQAHGATAAGGYTVSEMSLPSGTVVREYVSVDGKVFAVTWKGPTIPDLQQTLGDYFEEFKAAGAKPHAGHSHLSVNSSDLVLSSGGHMRAWTGRAYVPALLPPNFSLDDIK